MGGGSGGQREESDEAAGWVKAMPKSMKMYTYIFTLPLTWNAPIAVRGLCLLTMKPLTYAANVGEADLADKGASNPHVQVGGYGMVWGCPGVWCFYQKVSPSGEGGSLHPVCLIKARR